MAGAGHRKAGRQTDLLGDSIERSAWYSTSRYVTHCPDRLELFVTELEFRLVSIGETEFSIAIDAYARFGKGRHPAKPNMGDCYAYACARANHASLLSKGSDFMKTDIAAAARPL